MRSLWGLVAFIMATHSTPAISLDIRFCREPLGMQSGTIPDSALSASSAFDVPSVGPQHARLHVDRNGGAWCPKRQISENVREYLEIDLSTVMVISGIATQGRFGNGRGQEYAEAFQIEYWRQELHLWRTYRKWENTPILEGNWDTTTPVQHELNPPIIASKIRVVPYGVYPRTVCMRIELYGCNRTDLMAWYSLPVGSTWSPSLQLDDASYDGFLQGNTWSRGLGMLTDGYYGLDNFKMDLGTGKGHGWVGWKNETIQQDPILLKFHFNTIQNLSAVYIHCNNYFSRNVQVFSQAKLRFSLNGEKYSGKTVTYVYMPDLIMETARNVTIHIPNLCAIMVEIRLWFAAEWVMISEITFESEAVDGNFKFGHETSSSATEQINGRETFSVPRHRVPEEEETDISSTDFPEFNGGYFEAVVGALSAVMLILIVVILVIVFVNHHRKSMQEPLVNCPIPFEPSSRSDYGVAKPATTTLEKVPHLHEVSSEYQVPSTLHSTPIYENRVLGSVPCQPGESVKFSSLRATTTATTVLEAEQKVVNLSNYFPRMATDPVRRRSHTRSTTAGFTWNIKPLLDHVMDEKTLDNPAEIPRNSLKFIEWLGSTPMGEAYLCQISPEDVARSPAVVVRGGFLQDLGLFLREAKILGSLEHENLCSMIGTCAANNSGWMIYECPVYGDLNTYLQQHDISVHTALDLSVQISEGLNYLQDRGLFHRDLATRNCMVGPGLNVKISDWAMACAAFQGDYGEVRGRKPLPLRWLPWETLVLDKFSVGSAVWMLGVTLWEILANGKEKPYAFISDTQVILNADHYYYRDNKQVILGQPIHCSDQLYRLLLSCWSRDESERPSIADTVRFLRQAVTNSH